MITSPAEILIECPAYRHHHHDDSDLDDDEDVDEDEIYFTRSSGGPPESEPQLPAVGPLGLLDFWHCSFGTITQVDTVTRVNTIHIGCW